MPLSVHRKVALGFATALLVLLGISGASWRAVRSMEGATDAERRSTEMLASVTAVEQAMTAAETGQRGYLLTGDARYLTPYLRAVVTLPRAASDMRARASARELPIVDRAIRLADDKRAELNETITEWDGGRQAQALEIVKTSRGRALMDSLRYEMARLREIERGRLEERRTQARTETDRVGLIIMLGVLLTLAVAAFATAMVARDERARERASLALEKARDAAQSASHAKSDFLARMSHELRTPLNAIIGFSGVLLRNKRGALDTQELSYLSRIQSSGTQLLTIINDILDLAKVESGRMDVVLAPVDLRVLVRETAESFTGALVGRDVELALDIPDDVSPIRTDVNKLRQVITNLVANALKFTEHGRVVVQLVTDPGGARPWRLDVIDEGIGVAPSRQAAIFGAFEQAENSISRRFGGTGLGLAISKSICERLGYGLTVVSEDGVGSTFSILFDSAAKAPGRHERKTGGVAIGDAPAPTRSARSSGGITTDAPALVLIIDDSADSRLLLTQYVDDFGVQSIAAVGGEQGLQMALEFSPDLILLDLQMPGVDGWKVIERLKEDPATAEIPVVVVSILAAQRPPALARMAEVLPKPIDRDVLHASLRRHLAARAESQAATTELHA